MADLVDNAAAPVLIGMGGHARVVLELLRAMGLTPVGYCDRRAKPDYAGDLPFLGAETDAAARSILQKSPFLVTIGDNDLRRKLSQSLVAAGHVEAGPVVHPSARVSPSAALGEGAQILFGALVSSAATIGRGGVVNSGAIVEHDCRVGDFCHVAPGAVLAGGVSLGEGILVGLNASVLPGIVVGTGAVIGAGAVIVRDVPAGATVIGNPGRVIKQSGRQ